MVVVQIRRKGVLTVPADIRAELGLAEGDTVTMEVEDGRLIVTPVHVIPRDQAWFWTPEWQAGERRADDDLAARRGQVHDSTEAFFAALDAEPYEGDE